MAEVLYFPFCLQTNHWSFIWVNIIKQAGSSVTKSVNLEKPEEKSCLVKPSNLKALPWEGVSR